MSGSLMNNGQHGVHNNFVIAGSPGALFGIANQIAADAFTLIFGVNGNLHHPDGIVVDGNQHQSADEFVVQTFNAPDVQIICLLNPVRIQKL